MAVLFYTFFLLLQVSLSAFAQDELDTFPEPPPHIVRNYTTLTYFDPETKQTLNITYTLGARGKVVHNDDEIWGPEPLLLSWAIKDNTTIPLRKRGFGVKTQYAWPSAKITYKFDSATTESTLQDTFNDAIATWKEGAPYLEFEKLDPRPDDLEGVASITMHDEDDQWCKSNVALSRDSTPVMNLQWTDADGNDDCGQRPRTVIHELGHLLGLKHEHQRPDRDMFVTYHCENISPNLDNGKSCEENNCCDKDCCTDDSECCDGAKNFNTLNDDRFQKLGPYDCRSLMHYGKRGHHAKPGTNTLEGIGDCVIEHSETPTEGDYEAICQIYKTQCDEWRENNSRRCGTCNPTAGLNKCHPSTSCIWTGTSAYHCACAAGFKADTDDDDIGKHFRLPFEGYRHLVFVAENTECNVLCDNPYGFGPGLCAEVKLYEQCAV